MAEFLVVTGLSGAGRSQAAAHLEDLGWFVMDNLPRSLVAKVAELASVPGSSIDRVVLVVGRAPQEDILPALRNLKQQGHRVRIVFLDCATPELVRRYGHSRRPHPLAESTAGLQEAIEAERTLLEPVLADADVVIDTTGLNVHQLKARLADLFGPEDRSGIQVTVLSFGYKHGLPLDVDMILDCRFIPNPHWVERLRALPGTDAAVRDFVLDQPVTQTFVRHLEGLLAEVLPAFESEGKTFTTIAFGCTGGRHRSVALAVEFAKRLKRMGYDTNVVHRDVGR